MHRKARSFLPFHWWQVAPSCAYLLNRNYLLNLLTFSCIPKIFLLKISLLQSAGFKRFYPVATFRMQVTQSELGSASASALARGPLEAGTMCDIFTSRQRRIRLGWGRIQVTCFVCVHCPQTGHLSSRCLFLSRSAVKLHIAQANTSLKCRVGLSWDANPDPGSECHGRRRGQSGTGAVDSSSRARYTGTNMNIGFEFWNMYTNILPVTYLVFSVCTLAVQ